MIWRRFRYVVCQLDTLRRCFPASIQRALGELPTTLDETYERILLEIDKEKHGHAIRLFQCLAFSCRPLRAKELAEILAIQFDARGFPSLNAGWRLGDAEEAVLSACSSLVTITELGNHDDENEDDGDCDPRVVQFSHYSVKEFLTSERLAGSDRRELSKFYVSSEPAHTILAQSCISTLLQLDLQSQDTAPCLPLSKYAARNWFHHAQSDGVASRVLDGMDRLFDPDGTHLAAWVSIHDIDDPFWTFGSSMRPISPLYYAVLCGINILVEHLVISRQQDPNASRGDRGTPLHVAVIFGYTIIARFLLGCSADVNVRDKYNSTPLHEASANGNLDIVILLLRHGADVNAFDHQGDPPVYKALQSRKLDIAEILLKGGADINAWDKAKAIPLHEILKRGDLDIVQWLRSHGADLNALDGRGDSPLHKALRILKFDVAEILIKGGADVNVRNKDNSTALHDALERANPSYTAQFLLGHGADANALDSRGDHPLHKTLRSQRFDIMEILVKGGADVNARGKDNVIPLHEALERGNLNICSSFSAMAPT
jgi:ankyrin repeat protein